MTLTPFFNLSTKIFKLSFKHHNQSLISTDNTKRIKQLKNILTKNKMNKLSSLIKRKTVIRLIKRNNKNNKIITILNLLGRIWVVLAKISPPLPLLTITISTKVSRQTPFPNQKMLPTSLAHLPNKAIP